MRPHSHWQRGEGMDESALRLNSTLSNPGQKLHTIERCSRKTEGEDCKGDRTDETGARDSRGWPLERDETSWEASPRSDVTRETPEKCVARRDLRSLDARDSSQALVSILLGPIQRDSTFQGTSHKGRTARRRKCIREEWSAARTRSVRRSLPGRRFLRDLVAHCSG